MDDARRKSARRNARKRTWQMGERSDALAGSQRPPQFGHLMRLQRDTALREPAHSNAKRLLAKFQTASPRGLMNQHDEYSFMLGRPVERRQDCLVSGLHRNVFQQRWALLGGAETDSQLPL